MNYSTPNELVVRNIRGLLGANRESIASLSKNTDIPLSTLKRHLLGKSKFTIDEIYRISQHFDVPLPQVITQSLYPGMELSYDVAESHHKAN